jgi:hypothetical protein
MIKNNLSIVTLSQHVRAILACAVAACSICACSDSEDDASEDSTTEALEPSNMSFFVTSSTHDGDLGGLAGADEICQELAEAAGAGDKSWAAYLSVENPGAQPIHARTRIGEGPWYNSKGVLLAEDLTALHALVGDPELFITEKGEAVNGQWNGSNGTNGVPVNEHDIMTGSDAQGMLIMDMTTTCADWTSSTLTPGPQVGHTDGMGPNMDTSMPRFTSWGGGHPAQGCSATDLAARGGSGRFYCFAAN